MDWLDLLAVQESLNLLQQHSSKASVLQHSTFFVVHLSHPYMTTGKTIALTRWTFVGKVMSLLFNMLSRLVITFLPRSKPLLISWLQSPSAVILEPPQIKSSTSKLIIQQKRMILSTGFIWYHHIQSRASQVALVEKNPPSVQEMQETWFDPWVGGCPWRRAWQPTPVFLPGESHGQKSLVGYSPQGRKELDMRRQWHPTPVLLPGKSHGWRSLVGCSPWGR